MRRVLTLAMLLAGPAVAAPPAPNSDDATAMRGFENWVTTQHNHDGGWCCDLGDGRPLWDNEVRQRDGHWEVFHSKTHWDDGTNTWLPVPQSALLPNASPVGAAIAWVLHGRVLCLALSGAA